MGLDGSEQEGHVALCCMWSVLCNWVQLSADLETRTVKGKIVCSFKTSPVFSVVEPSCPTSSLRSHWNSTHTRSRQAKSKQELSSFRGAYRGCKGM